MKKWSVVVTVIVIAAGTPVVGWAQADEVKPFLGKWQLLMQNQGETIVSTLTIIRKKNGTLTGTWQSRRGLTYVKNLKVKDGVLSFSPIYTTKAGEFLMVSSAKIKNGTLVGKMKWPGRGDLSFKAVRLKPGAKVTKPTAPTGVRGPGGFFESLDTNGDGKIQLDEAPERMKRRFATIDQNGDGGLDKDELETLLWSRRSRQK